MTINYVLYQFRINVNIRRLGGGYGSKISRCSQIASACAVAASVLNRTVRFVLPIETNMSAIGKRVPCSSDYEVLLINKIIYFKGMFQYYVYVLGWG